MYISIPVSIKQRIYTFLPKFGILKSKNTYKIIQSQLPKGKTKKILELVQNPYQLDYHPVIPLQRESYPSWIKIYAKLLNWAYKNIYILFWCFSHLRLNVFDNAESAIRFFCGIFPQNQKILCLPRSVFAATTSKKFDKEGAMFIGVFFPSRHMHAWIIESNRNPCWFDNIWINFNPIAIMI